MFRYTARKKNPYIDFLQKKKLVQLEGHVTECIVNLMPLAVNDCERPKDCSYDIFIHLNTPFCLKHNQWLFPSFMVLKPAITNSSKDHGCKILFKGDWSDSVNFQSDAILKCL